MCIRDSAYGQNSSEASDGSQFAKVVVMLLIILAVLLVMACLLYTSDAADERSSVDLGGRRIIKKNNSVRTRESTVNYQ